MAWGEGCAKGDCYAVAYGKATNRVMCAAAHGGMLGIVRFVRRSWHSGERKRCARCHLDCSHEKLGRNTAHGWSGYTIYYGTQPGAYTNSLIVDDPSATHAIIRGYSRVFITS